MAETSTDFNFKIDKLIENIRLTCGLKSGRRLSLALSLLCKR
jgi:hypothetical protein